MNIGYLLEYLRGKQGLVTMGVKTERDPILFTHGPSPLVVIMPMFVQWEPVAVTQAEEVRAEAEVQAAAEAPQDPVPEEKPKRSRKRNRD